jgi:hypothetical protein
MSYISNRGLQCTETQRIRYHVSPVSRCYTAGNDCIGLGNVLASIPDPCTMVIAGHVEVRMDTPTLSRTYGPEDIYIRPTGTPFSRAGNHHNQSHHLKDIIPSNSSKTIIPSKCSLPASLFSSPPLLAYPPHR